MTDAEIDIEIGRRLFGFRHLKFTRSDGTTFVQFISKDSADTAYIRSLNPVEVESGDDLQSALKYSTDIACAFQVVEKMREGGWDGQIDIMAGGFDCQFNRCESSGKFDEICKGDVNPARAICLAAIAAIGEK